MDLQGSSSEVHKEIFSKLLDSQFTKLDGQLKEWENFNKSFLFALEYPSPPEDVYLKSERLEKLEKHSAFLKFHGIEKYFTNQGNLEQSGKKLDPE